MRIELKKAKIWSETRLGLKNKNSRIGLVYQCLMISMLNHSKNKNKICIYKGKSPL